VSAWPGPHPSMTLPERASAAQPAADAARTAVDAAGDTPTKASGDGCGHGGTGPQMLDLSHLPAVDCAPWCTDGTGHIHEWHPSDQRCGDERTRVPLRREPMSSTDNDDPWMSFLDVALNREWEGQPYVSVDKNAVAGGFTMTLDEAEQLGNALLERVKLARQ
jgi:hypothetical protein